MQGNKSVPAPLNLYKPRAEVAELVNPDSLDRKITRGQGRQRLGRGEKPMSQCIFDQIRRGAQVELFHHLCLVEFDGAGRNLEPLGDILHRAAFGQQL